MLNIENYSITYTDGTKLKYADIHVKKGEFVGMFGKSGCGKTSLLESLFSTAFPGKVEYKTALLDGKPLPKPGYDLYKKVSYCPQFSQAALNPKLTVKEHIRLTLLGNGIKEEDSRLDEYLTRLGLDKSMLTRKPSELSGGQLQRMVMLLCVLKKPQLLIMDEPSSAIDLITLKDIAAFLESMKGECTMLMVAHSRPLLEKIADRIIDF